ncbi:DUF2637 domain-containing protein (plasmid) [Streptomyces sp. NBC_01005]|uniref:DUF2637 domain-containing protein n=1 Tax=Streptomyces sp. NBC_01005 TaxID=2903715 RepID=UPI002F9081A9|nr:DUF2637 domain-containing protein [Streptomyces sp. NBC_01005]WSW11541.1 DUF2637 domain-containing protein [Streptomyces sp. NBC_01005]
MSRIETLTPAQIQSAERALSAGTWGITAGAVLFSVLTVTPLVERVTPDGWGWTAWILPLVVDTAVVIVVRLDSTVSRLRTSAGRWPALLRWLTGLMTLLLNVGDSALKGDMTGVAVHSVAPLLLIVTAEAARSYRAAIGRALDRIEREQVERERAEKAEREQAEQRSRADREQREARERAEREQTAARREQSERETREHAERLERERLDREATERKEQRAHTLQVERERADREATERKEQREREEAREAREREERERVARGRQQRETAERAAREQLAMTRRMAREQQPRPVNTGAPAVNTEAPAVNKSSSTEPSTPSVNTTKLGEQAAREHIAAAVNANPGVTVRTLADETGWSIGWVSARRQELQTAGAEQ